MLHTVGVPVAVTVNWIYYEVFVLLCFVVLGIRPRTSHMTGKCFTNELHPIHCCEFGHLSGPPLSPSEAALYPPCWTPLQGLVESPWVAEPK